MKPANETPTLKPTTQIPREALVVDDNEGMGRIVKVLLETENIESMIAINGEDALKRLSERGFDLLITDLEMPKMNGMDLLKRIRQKHSDLPVVLMSGTLSPQTSRAALEEGASAVLKKPFGRKELSEVIESLFPSSKSPRSSSE